MVPRTGVLFGAYVDPDGAWSGNGAAQSEVLNFERALGRRISINQHYYAWTNTFPSGLEQWDISRRKIPLVSWEGTSLSSINSGAYDSMIRARAIGLRKLGKPVFLRWGWEMNGNWYAWDGAHNGGSAAPARYIRAWRRIHGIVRRAGANNVIFVWSPNHLSAPNKSWNKASAYYPGDAYVDWVGIDGYNWGGSNWKSFESVFAPVYNLYAKRKPIMISETASPESGGNKARWITETRTVLKTKFPSVAAFLWFHVDKERDWRANSSRATFRAFRAMATDPYFKPTVAGIRWT